MTGLHRHPTVIQVFRSLTYFLSFLQDADLKADPPLSSRTRIKTPRRSSVRSEPRSIRLFPLEQGLRQLRAGREFWYFDLIRLFPLEQGLRQRIDEVNIHHTIDPPLSSRTRIYRWLERKGEDGRDDHPPLSACYGQRFPVKPGMTQQEARNDGGLSGLSTGSGLSPPFAFPPKNPTFVKTTHHDRPNPLLQRPIRGGEGL